MNPVPRITPKQHHPAELQDRIAKFNDAAAAVAAAQQENDARLVELHDPATLTAKEAGARLKQIATARVERLANLARVRALAVEGGAILAECLPANNAEMARLNEATRARWQELRDGLKALGITEELQVRKAACGDAALHELSAAAGQVGQGHPQLSQTFRDMLTVVDAQIAAMLTA